MLISLLIDSVQNFPLARHRYYRTDTKHGLEEKATFCCKLKQPVPEAGFIIHMYLESKMDVFYLQTVFFSTLTRLFHCDLNCLFNEEKRYQF